MKSRRSLGIALGVALACLVLAMALIPSMTPVLKPPSEAEAVPAAKPSYLSGRTVPAVESVKAVFAALPTEMDKLPMAATAPPKPVSNCMTPVASATKAYAGGDWKTPNGIVVEISAYPAGLGYRAQKCSTATTVIRHGDVVAHIFETRAKADVGAIERAMTAGIRDCADTSAYADDQALRNPTMEGFTGWLQSEAVTFDGQAPPRVDDLRPADVTLPTPPPYPHSPERLPNPPQQPKAVLAPEYPPVVINVPLRVPDPVGPGCGWAFTGMIAPPEDPPQWKTDAEKSRTQAKEQLKAAVSDYHKKLKIYERAKADFDQLNPAWERYAEKVKEIDDAWRQQGERWTNYDKALEEWRKAKQAYDKFVAEQRKQQADYERQMRECQAPQPIPQPEPLPSDGEPSDDLPTPVPTPTPTVACPTRPTILDAPAPQLPASPVPPVEQRGR